MNKENIERLIVHLKTLKARPYKDVGFNMGTFIETASEHSGLSNPDINKHPCNTVACIAGHAVILANINEIHDAEKITEEIMPVDQMAYDDEAADFLGLDEDQAEFLFHGQQREKITDRIMSANLDNISLEDAIFALEHLLKTGNVKWPDKLMEDGGNHDE